MLDLLAKYRAHLKEFLNVSDVHITEAHGVNEIQQLGSEHNVSISGATFDKAKVEVIPASGHKCARCWNFMPEVSNYGIWQNVCTRCHNALHEMGIPEPEAEK